jgi:SAM-dependent methyltransferase
LSLRDAWEEQAPNWIRWAREPGHDSYWRFHRESFLESLPTPGRRTLDVGCGEGRVTRDLRDLGHRMVGVDQSSTMIAAAREADPEGEYLVANAAELPFEDSSFDLAIGFMVLMDLDDMAGAVAEVGRVLERRGRFVMAVVHPINSAGEFVPRHGVDDAPYVIQSYLDRRPYSDRLARDGHEITFHSNHWTIEDYSRAFETAGFLMSEVREIYDDENPRWRRMPLFLRWTGLKQ